MNVRTTDLPFGVSSCGTANCADPDDRPRRTPRIDRDYQTLRDGMRTLFRHLAIDTAA